MEHNFAIPIYDENYYGTILCNDCGVNYLFYGGVDYNTYGHYICT